MPPKPEPRRAPPDVQPDSVPKKRESDVLPDDPRQPDPRQRSDVAPDSVSRRPDEQDQRVNSGT